MGDMSVGPWFAVSGRGRHYPWLRLFCFPYAGGGSSSFRNWEDDLPPGVEVWAVVPPGRENRFAEPSYRRLPPLAESLANAIEPHLGLPSIFFGHSLGALVAYEVACILQARGFSQPECLFVSGHRAPHLPVRCAPTHTLPDDRLAIAMGRLGGMSEEILRNPELMEVLLPTIRSDLEVAETYSYVPHESLRCPMAACGGDSDPSVNGAELAAWREHTRSSFVRRVFPGGHFYLHQARSDLLAAISAEIRLISS